MLWYFFSGKYLKTLQFVVEEGGYVMLKACAALGEDLSSVLRTHTGATHITHGSMGSNDLFWLLRTLHSLVHISPPPYTQTWRIKAHFSLYRIYVWSDVGVCTCVPVCAETRGERSVPFLIAFYFIFETAGLYPRTGVPGARYRLYQLSQLSSLTLHFYLTGNFL